MPPRQEGPRRAKGRLKGILRAEEFLDRLRSDAMWPLIYTKQWKALYEQVYGEELQTWHDDYKRLKSAVESVRASYKMDHPD